MEVPEFTNPEFADGEGTFSEIPAGEPAIKGEMAAFSGNQTQSSLASPYESDMVYEEASAYDEPVTGMEEESTLGFGALLVFEGLLCIAFLIQRRNS